MLVALSPFMRTKLCFVLSVVSFLPWIFSPEFVQAQAVPLSTEAAMLVALETGSLTFVRRKVRAGLFSHRHALSEASVIERAVIAESARFDFDPVLTLAIIEHESGFGSKMRGRHGEIGLMQIKPSTARWLTKRSGVRYEGARTLEDPASNIRIGVTYLAYLRDCFPRQGHHYLAAYNMGQGNARRALRHNRGSGPYARHVIRRYRKYHAEMVKNRGWA